jgi:hypothetical protein
VTDTFQNARALVIGVGGDLPVTADDAKAVAKIFADPERCAVPERNVRVLTKVTQHMTASLRPLRNWRGWQRPTMWSLCTSPATVA